MEVTVDGRWAHLTTGNSDLDPELETVVFVHGVGQDHTVWVLPIRYFARHNRNVIAVDLPGHGRSEGPPLQTIESMAGWVMQVMDSASIDRAAVVGHSMGSLVALEAAGSYPERIRSVAMVGISVPLRVSDILMETSETGDHDALEMLTYWGHSRWAQVGGNDTPGIWMTGAYMRLLEKAPSGSIHTDLMACDRYDAGLVAAKTIECPALFLLGSRDRMTPVRGARELIDSIPEADTVIFDGAGHALLAERPDQVLDELINVV